MSAIDNPQTDAPEGPVAQTSGLSLDSAVALHPLRFLDEGDDVTVGRPDVDDYYVLPADGAALIRKLVEGLTPLQAQDWYEGEYGEKVDIAEFLDTLRDLDFVRREPAGTDPAESLPGAGPVRWQRLGRAVFSPPAWVVYAALIAVAAVVTIRHHELAPRNGNVFFTSYVTVIELSLFLGQFPLLLLHEAFHALAGRRLGLRSSLGIGRRLYFVVFETRMDGLVSVPRGQRYLPMLAGMLMDVLVMAALTIIAWVALHPDGSRSLVSGLALALAYMTGLRLLWQFYFYLGTDLYYVVVTVCGCVDLQAAAKAVIANRYNRWRRRPDRIVDEEQFHPRDRAVSRWYSWLVVVGYTVSILTLVVAVLPVAYRMLTRVFARFVDSGQSTGHIVDSVVFLGLNAAQILVIWWLVRREKRSRTAADSSPGITKESA